MLPALPNKYLGDFVRGYFDGDGHVWSGFVNKKRSKPTRVLQVGFTSGCGEFLFDLNERLHQLGIVKGGSIVSVKNKDCRRLIFSTLDALKLSKVMYNNPDKLFLKRKKLVFEQFEKMRP